MATIRARRAGAPMLARAFVVVCALLALLLPAIWVAVGTYVLRTRAANQMAAASAAAQANFDQFLGRISKTMDAFRAADAHSANRVLLAARMIGLEAKLAPADNLFLYDASGRFVAATVPLLPGEDFVGRTAWFRSVAAALPVGGLILFGPAREPLGERQGFVITRPLAGPTGMFAGAVGTFLGLGSFRGLLAPAYLPPGSRVTLRAAGSRGTVLAFSVPGATPPGGLVSELTGVGQKLSVSATASLAGGLEWHATAGAFSEMTAAEGRAIVCGAALLAAGPLLLLVVLRFRRRDGSRSRAVTEDPGFTTRRPEPEWMWEINAEGLLVGVGGNAPRPLVEAVGRSFFDVVVSGLRSEDLRNAIARRTPVRDVTIGVALPGDAAGAPRQFSVAGFPVENTGGFWGTATEVCATAEGRGEQFDPRPDDTAASVQATATSANAPSVRPSSVLPRRLASVLRCAASM
ncbi:MAG: PDC sensor domain-containing protein [Acetobacteraceae bacterium]